MDPTEREKQTEKKVQQVQEKKGWTDGNKQINSGRKPVGRQKDKKK